MQYFERDWHRRSGLVCRLHFLFHRHPWICPHHCRHTWFQSTCAGCPLEWCMTSLWMLCWFVLNDHNSCPHQSSNVWINAVTSLASIFEKDQSCIWAHVAPARVEVNKCFVEFLHLLCTKGAIDTNCVWVGMPDTDEKGYNCLARKKFEHRCPQWWHSTWQASVVCPPTRNTDPPSGLLPLSFEWQR